MLLRGAAGHCFGFFAATFMLCAPRTAALVSCNDHARVASIPMSYLQGLNLCRRSIPFYLSRCTDLYCNQSFVTIKQHNIYQNITRYILITRYLRFISTILNALSSSNRGVTLPEKESCSVFSSSHLAGGRCHDPSIS